MFSRYIEVEIGKFVICVTVYSSHHNALVCYTSFLATDTLLCVLCFIIMACPVSRHEEATFIISKQCCFIVQLDDIPAVWASN